MGVEEEYFLIHFYQTSATLSNHQLQYAQNFWQSLYKSKIYNVSFLRVCPAQNLHQNQPVLHARPQGLSPPYTAAG